LDISRFADGLPSLAAAFMDSDAIDTGVAGSASLDDRFHIGSNAKAMTATLAAVAVERGLLDWTTPAVDVLDVNGSSLITLERLLAHAGGIRPLVEDEELALVPTGRRADAARLLLSAPPLFEPGTDNVYSNGGYTVAAAMLEEVTGTPWETLLQTWLAVPLSIELGIGWPAGLAGHYERDGALVRHDRGDGYRVHASIAPAGDVSAGVAAYARFVQLHLRGLRGRPELLTSESFQRLHTPLRGPFALGWGVQEWEGARTSVHAGSAGTFYALVAVQPERGSAVVVMTNAGGSRAEAASVELARDLVRRHGASQVGLL
jgi:CubicO group peptidase (beta-lactamase class C family)